MLHFLRHLRLVKPIETQSKPAAKARYKYTKVLDARKSPIRHLWIRNGTHFARVTTEDQTGGKKLQWVRLAGSTAAEAQKEVHKLLVEREQNQLPHIGRSPTFEQYLETTYLPRLAGSGKKKDTLVTEQAHYNRWKAALGHLRLDKIRPGPVLDLLTTMRQERSARTCNLALVCLRHVFKSAKRDGFLKVLPTEDVPWHKTERKSRGLFTAADIDQICLAAMAASKNGLQFTDYLRFLAFSGAREQEALRIQWQHVQFDQKFVTVGAEGDTKNHEARHVNFNPQLECHLRAMHERRDPFSLWLFPSPQRGDVDRPAKTFRETLLLARSVGGVTCRNCRSLHHGERIPEKCPQCRRTDFEILEKTLSERLQKFGFHDCRHHFISFAVMSGIDFMTIARWVGHKDGGILIGKVYGHLSNEHAKAQGARLNFGPVVLEEARG